MNYTEVLFPGPIVYFWCITLCSYFHPRKEGTGRLFHIKSVLSHWRYPDARVHGVYLPLPPFLPFLIAYRSNNGFLYLWSLCRYAPVYTMNGLSQVCVCCILLWIIQNYSCILNSKYSSNFELEELTISRKLYVSFLYIKIYSDFQENDLSLMYLLLKFQFCLRFN